MRKTAVTALLTTFVLLATTNVSYAQLVFAKLLSPDAGDVKMGWGATLKFSFATRSGGYATLDGGALVFMNNDPKIDGWVTIPAKLGYVYTFNKTGNGWYVEPQLGYNFFGLSPTGGQHRGGVAWSIGTGYLFAPSGHYDIGLRYDNASFGGATMSYASLRLARNFVIGKNKPRTTSPAAGNKAVAPPAMAVPPQPEMDASKPYATLTFFTIYMHPFVAPIGPFKIYINDTVAFKLPSNGLVNLQVTRPGKYVIKDRKKDKQPTTLDIKPGEHYYLYFDYRHDKMYTKAILRVVSAQEAIPEFDKLKKIEKKLN